MRSVRPAPLRLILAAALLVAACDDPTVVQPELAEVTIVLPSTTLAAGETSTATAAGADQNGAVFALGPIVWSTSASSVATVTEAGVVKGVGAGTARILATAEGRSGQITVTVVAPAAIKINEIESNGGTPGDWIELYNGTGAAVSLAGWVVKDNDDTHVHTLPAGTSIAAGAYLMVEEAALGFGLGSADAVRLFNPFGAPVDSYDWTTHAAVTYGRCANGTGPFAANATATKAAANDCRVTVRINEVESNGGTPGDWIELINTGAAPANVGGYLVKDNDDTRTFALPAGTTIPAGGFLVVEEATFGFGLGGADAARLIDPAGAVVDSYTWEAHAAVTYGRCPDGTGAFAPNAVSTKGAANSCGGGGGSGTAWPGTDDVTVVDETAAFTSNLSGLTYEGATGGSPAVIWAVVNGPGTLMRMIKSGALWVSDPTNGWAAGKALRYKNGAGNPDSEGVTFASGGSAAGMYVSTERNNDASTVSKNTVLRFDPTQAGTTLTATHEWDITADLPVVGANLGIETITWVPDSYLTAKAFFDEAAGKVYAPADYPDHGAGLFFIGLEGNGSIYVYALNHTTSTARRVATIVSGFTGMMGLEFDRDLSYLWATCDDTCNNKFAVLEVDTRAASATRGKFVVNRVFDRPATLPNSNNEGFAIAPATECVGGMKPVFWADDNDIGGNSLRRGSVQCAAFAPLAGPALVANRNR